MLMHKVMMIVVLVFVGFLVSRYGWGRRFVDAVTKYLFYFVIPATVFISIMRSPDIPMSLLSSILAFIHLFTLFVITIAIAPLILKSLIDRLALVFMVSLPNTVFLAVPLSIAILGNALYVLPHAIAFNAMLPITLAYASRSGRSRRVASTFMSTYLYAFVFLLSIALRMFVTYPTTLRVPEIVLNIVTLSNYLAFLVLGASMAPISIVKRSFFASVLLLRLVISPLLLQVLLALAMIFVYISKKFVLGLMMQSFMPPAVTNIVIARMLKLDEQNVCTTTVLLTLISTIIVLTIFQFV